MKRLILATLVVLATAGWAFGAHFKNEAAERERFQTLLEYCQGDDPPARHTAVDEMRNFRPWIDDELLKRISTCTPMERLAFINVLVDRRCRAFLEPATKMLPDAVERLRVSRLVALAVTAKREKMKEAEKAGNQAEATRLEQEILAERQNIMFFDFQRGDEVFMLSSVLADFGHEEALKVLVDLAIQSSVDDSAAKGEPTKFSRTHRDKLLPGGTEMWNTIYTPIWEALRKIATRSLDLKVIRAQRDRLTVHFEKLAKTPGIGPNQDAAIKNYEAVKASMLKVEKKTSGEGEEKDDGGTDDDQGGGKDPDVKVIKG